MVVEREHCAIEVFDTGVTGHPDAAYWPSFVARLGHATMPGDLVVVISVHVIEDRVGFPDAGAALDPDSALGFVPVLSVAGDDIDEVFV